MMSIVNAAIVGLGEWGQKLVRSVQGKSNRIRFVATTTRNLEKARAFASEQSLDLYEDLKHVLAAPDIEALVLTTPHTHHATQIVAAAKAGKSVFVEKPLALTKSSALEAVAACRQANVVLGVGHNRRFLPALREFKRLLAAGEIGKPMLIEGNLSSNSGFKHGPAAWRASRVESPAGAMTSLGIHVLDAMIYLLGEIREVSSYSTRIALPIDIDDSTAATFKFANGALGYLGTVFASMPIWRLQVLGSAGWIEMRGPERLIIQTADGKLVEKTFPSVDIERAELDAFADAIRGKSPYPVSAEDAVHGIAVLESLAYAADHGIRVMIS
jgi:predicted dehydrogenase